MNRNSQGSIAVGPFHETVAKISRIGFTHYQHTLLDNVSANKTEVAKSLRDFKPSKNAESAIVISAGPSLHRQKSIQQIKTSGYSGHVVAVDGALVACLREGLVPDYVLTLDPHPTRIVSWFGDPNLEKNTEGDDYFIRQDLDVNFQINRRITNQEHIELVNRYGSKIKALVATTAPANVVKRLKEAHFDLYWWNPLVDNPLDPESLTRQMYRLISVPCMNTGGTVGNAAWVFAATRLPCKTIALTGMDFGYFQDTPYTKTQTYHELVQLNGGVKDLEQYFEQYRFPLTGEQFYTDPTYYWYRRNFLDLHKAAGKAITTVNCTEGGTLFIDGIPCLFLKDFLARFSE
jgi:hypothetical protein